MSTTLQRNRTISLKTPLGGDVLLVDTMTVTEQLGQPFECELDLLSRDEQIKLEDLLGQTMTVSIELPGGDQPRCFHGHVSRFSQIGRKGSYAHYRATLRPWLWFLTRTADCRIFQNKTVPEIIKEIFREHGFSDFDELLTGDYRTWDYRVQYRETDFDFVSRLMEQEGLYYYFLHEDDKHTLRLSDSYSSHDLISGYEQLPYYPPTENEVREEHVFDWMLTQEIQPGSYALNEYDFEKPKAGLAVKSTISRAHAKADMEVYDYPGAYAQKHDGETYARVRIEELHAGYERVRGRSNARGLFAGGLFELANFPREDQNREYLLTSVTHEFTADPYESGAAGGGGVYTCSFVAIDSKQPYRSPRITPKPTVQGPQTATVVGKAGETIWTDEYGRVTVQFHWDRNGKSDENSSCWVRVSQNRAGQEWGEMYLPHVGQEVIVSFLEGDPDRPIITGRVYNADNMPPLDLPSEQTRLAMRDQGGNEIIMEGEDGKQFIQLKQSCGNEIYMDGVEKTIRIYSPSHESSITLGKSVVTYTTSDNVEHSVGNKKTYTQGHMEEEFVGTKTSKNMSASHTTTFGATNEIYVGTKTSETMAVNVEFAANLDRKVSAADRYQKAKGVISTESSKQLVSTVEKSKIDITPDMIKLESGTASIKIAKNGDITIDSPGNISLIADGDIKLQPKACKLNTKTFKIVGMLDHGNLKVMK